MSLEALHFRLSAGRADRLRDRKIPLPQGITECRNIPYGPWGRENLLDVCYPQDAKGALPTIVSIHGGGYVYGSKEIYRRYAMDMARRGFAFVNFNYRLAPKWKFPTPLVDANAVLEWVVLNAGRYHLDTRNIFLVGDSAGAQLASHYAAIYASQDFASLFPFTVPEMTVRGLGLNCGMYDPALWGAEPRKGLPLDYLGRDIPADDPRLRVLPAIGESYPPAYLTTACHDFLRENARPMCEYLQSRGVESQWKCYGTEENPEAGHVFHVNIRLEEAKQCNDDTAAFFRRLMEAST